MGWKVGLTGDGVDFRMLADSLTGRGYTISEESEAFVLTSPEFEALNDAETIRAHAAAFVSLLNGAARLAFGTQRLIGIGAVTRGGQHSNRAVSVSRESLIEFRQILSFSVSHPDGSTKTCDAAGPIGDWTALALTDAAVCKTLQLLSSGECDWVNLYSILEVVADDVGGIDKITARGWATARGVTLFKRTANSPDAVGCAARHRASSSTMPPAKPMTLPDAPRSLVIGIAGVGFVQRCHRRERLHYCKPRPSRTWLSTPLQDALSSNSILHCLDSGRPLKHLMIPELMTRVAEQPHVFNAMVTTAHKRQHVVKFKFLAAAAFDAPACHAFGLLFEYLPESSGLASETRTGNRGIFRSCRPSPLR